MESHHICEHFVWSNPYVCLILMKLCRGRQIHRTIRVKKKSAQDKKGSLRVSYGTSPFVMGCNQ